MEEKRNDAVNLPNADDFIEEFTVEEIDTMFFDGGHCGAKC